jgi:hypothetical protein
MTTKTRKQRLSSTKPCTLEDLYAQFPTEDDALDWLRHKLYPEKIYCVNCRKTTKHHRISGRKVYGCDYCGHQISPTAGTIFHKSSTSLRIWLYVIFQMSQTRTSISAKQIERKTGVTYKTAWRMCAEIRKRLHEGLSPFSDYVDAHETYYVNSYTNHRNDVTLMFLMTLDKITFDD